MLTMNRHLSIFSLDCQTRLQFPVYFAEDLQAKPSIHKKKHYLIRCFAKHKTITIHSIRYLQQM